MIGFPLFYLIFVSFIFELSSKGILAVALSPLFYLASFFWIISGVGIRQMRQWAWYTLGAAQLFITYLNALTLVHNSESDFKVYAFGLTLAIQYLAHIMVSQELRVPFLFPKLKWWESGIAGMHHMKVEIVHTTATGVSTGQLLDLSLKGCFIKSPIDFESMEKISLKLEGYGQDVEVPGIIVWNAKSTVTHPKGIGVKFLDLDRNKRRKVKVITKRFVLEKESKDVTAKIPA